MQQTFRPPFPEFFDNSARNYLIACETKYYYGILRHLKPKGEGNVDLVSGAAIASGLEAFRRAFYLEGLSHDESLYRAIIAALIEYGDFQPPENVEGSRKYKNAEHVCRALVYYFDHYNPRTDHLQPYNTANPFEFTFAIPIEVAHPETGNPILYVGRQDMIARYNNDCYGDDEKSTTSLGKTWARSFDLDSQFTGYTWGMLESGIPARGVIARGISMLAGGHGFEESVQLRSAWEIHRWMEQLIKDLERAKSAWARGDYDLVLDRRVCGLYGGCTFAKLCTKMNPESYIEMNYEPIPWDPTQRRTIIRSLSFNSAE